MRRARSSATHRVLPRPPGRPHGEAGAPGDALDRAAAPAARRPPPPADRDRRDPGEDPRQRPGGDRRAAARALPARAAQGHPEGARRGRRRCAGARRVAYRRRRPPRRGARRGAPRPRPAQAARPRDLVGGQPPRELARVDRRPALAGAHRRSRRPRRGTAHPRGRPLRPRRREGSRPRAPLRAQAPRRARARRRGPRPRRLPRPHPALPRPAGHGPDLRRPLHRPRARPQVRARLAGRGARRGGHPRAPAHLRRRHAGPRPRGHQAGGHPEPRLPPRRDRQARRLLPGRPRVRAPRGPRPGAEPRLRRPLPGRALRSLRGALHLHRQLPRGHPRPAARPDGADHLLRLHRGREGGDRAALPAAPPGGGERPRRRPWCRSPRTRCAP